MGRDYLDQSLLFFFCGLHYLNFLRQLKGFTWRDVPRHPSDQPLRFLGHIDEGRRNDYAALEKGTPLVSLRGLLRLSLDFSSRAFAFLASSSTFASFATMSGTSSSENCFSSSSSSSSSGEALEAMLVAVAEGISSQAPVPSALEVATFAWVHKDVLENQSKMTHSEVGSLVEEGKWVRGSHAGLLKVVRYGKRERVCHATKEGEEPFIYMYETTLLDLGVTLPFDFFEADVLRGLGIAPSQLHPNGWAAIQAFKVVCLALGMLSSALVFLSHYTTRVGQSVGWVSLMPLPNTGLFTSYTASYKGFKSRFVKIQALETSHFCIDSRPLPLYWREPSKFKGLVRSQLHLEAKVDLQILDSLPRGMNCRDIVSWISTNNATLCLKNMLKKQGVDMAELIKKARLTNDARSSGRKASGAETAATAAEKKSVASLAEKDSVPVVEKLTTLVVSDKEAGKRKANSTTAEEAATKKGKATAPPPPPLPT
ncbi:hypothetical protein CR513_58795, partial [Mucuna pruriens]